MKMIYIFTLISFLVSHAWAREQHLEIKPWKIRLESGERAVIDGHADQQKIVIYRNKRQPLFWQTKILGNLKNDSVRNLRTKWNVFKNSTIAIPIPGGHKLYRFENKEFIFWLLKSGHVLQLEKRTILPTTAKFDIQRVSVATP